MLARERAELGFSILELMVAMAIFLVLCGAMFGLLQVSQQKYSSETQLSGAVQDARLALDQIVRDFNVSGYPSLEMFSSQPTLPVTYALGPVAWSPNYPSAVCTIGTGGGGSCTTPGDYDLILETRLGTDPSVSWVRYQLISTTLYRGVVQKSSTDPATATSGSGVMVPFLANVVNAVNPNGSPQPIFRYTCDTPGGPIACASSAAGLANSPLNIRDVDVTLIVATPQRDMQTQVVKFVELNGRGHRSNPTN